MDRVVYIGFVDTYFGKVREWEQTQIPDLFCTRIQDNKER
jgi:hypothetical protein